MKDVYFNMSCCSGEDMNEIVRTGFLGTEINGKKIKWQKADFVSEEGHGKCPFCGDGRVYREEDGWYLQNSEDFANEVINFCPFCGHGLTRRNK